MDVRACYAFARVNTKRARLLFAVLTAGVLLLPGCVPRESARPVVVQGAMDVEIRKLAGALEHGPKRTSADSSSGAARSTAIPS